MRPSHQNKLLQSSDEKLIEWYCREKNLEILGILFEKYMLMVYGICLKYLKNRDDSQDAVMQIFEVLINDIPKYNIRNFKSWLYGVCRNHCLLKLRKDESERKKQNTVSVDNFMETTEISHPIDEYDDKLKMQEKLKECLDRLKDKQRLCIELFYYKYKCYREIARELSLEEKKVKSYIQNGKRNLKICLEQKEKIKNV